jgi:hypothetical protein
MARRKGVIIEMKMEVLGGHATEPSKPREDAP